MKVAMVVAVPVEAGALWILAHVDLPGPDPVSNKYLEFLPDSILRIILYWHSPAFLLSNSISRHPSLAWSILFIFGYCDLLFLVWLALLLLDLLQAAWRRIAGGADSAR